MAPEEFPITPNAGDLAHSVARAVVGSLVKLGVPEDVASSLLDCAEMFSPAPLRTRQKLFIDGLARKVESHDSMLATSLAADPERFAAFASGIFRQVAETAEKEKIAYFQNALINAAREGVDQLDYFRNLLDALTVDHVRILVFFSTAQGGERLRAHYVAEDAAKRIAKSLPEFAEREEYAEALFRDVWSRCLLAFPLSVATVAPPSTEDLYRLDGPRLSVLGEGFLALIQDPEERF